MADDLQLGSTSLQGLPGGLCFIVDLGKVCCLLCFGVYWLVGWDGVGLRLDLGLEFGLGVEFGWEFVGMDMGGKG